MIKYILPNFYDGYFCNLTIKQKLFQKRKIIGVSGSFPFSIFNGSYNNTKYEKICLYEDMVKIIEDYGMLSDMVILDYGNPYLENYDYYDLYNQVVLKEFANNPNFYFSVSQESFIEYLITKYPNINIILHQNFTRINSSEDIQSLILKHQKNIKGIVITSFNMCENISGVFKVYLTPIHGCEECVQYERCLEHDNKAVLEYSGESQFAECHFRKIIYPDIVAERIKYVEKYCDYIMFDTVVDKQQQEEFSLIETVIEKMEE